MEKGKRPDLPQSHKNYVEKLRIFKAGDPIKAMEGFRGYSLQSKVEKEGLRAFLYRNFQTKEAILCLGEGKVERALLWVRLCLENEPPVIKQSTLY